MTQNMIGNAALDERFHPLALDSIDDNWQLLFQQSMFASQRLATCGMTLRRTLADAP
jgi:hypothetical protein